MTEDERCAGRFWWRQYLEPSPKFDKDARVIGSDHHAVEVFLSARDGMPDSFGLSSARVAACVCFAQEKQANRKLTAREILGLPPEEPKPFNAVHLSERGVVVWTTATGVKQTISEFPALGPAESRDAAKALAKQLNEMWMDDPENASRTAMHIHQIETEAKAKPAKPMTKAEVAAEIRAIAGAWGLSRQGAEMRLTRAADAVEALPEPEPAKVSPFAALVADLYESAKQNRELESLDTFPMAYYKIVGSLGWVFELASTGKGVHRNSIVDKLCLCASLCQRAAEDLGLIAKE